MDALCFLYDNGGTVTWPLDWYAQNWGTSTEKAVEILCQLGDTKVAEVEWLSTDLSTGLSTVLSTGNSNDAFIANVWQTHSKTIAKDSKNILAKLSNRRMVREICNAAKIHEIRVEAGRKGASKRWQNTHSKNSPSYPNLTKISSNDSTKVDTSERKKIKKEKTAVALQFQLPDWINQESWNGYIEMRRKIRYPLTPHAMNLLLKKLIEFKDRGIDPNVSLDEATVKSWRSVYEPKGGNNGNGTAPKGWETLKRVMARSKEEKANDG